MTCVPIRQSAGSYSIFAMSISSQIITLYAHDYIKIDANFDSILCSTKIFRPVYYVSSTANVHNSQQIQVSSSIILRDFICWLKIQKLFEQNVASGHIFLLLIEASKCTYILHTMFEKIRGHSLLNHHYFEILIGRHFFWTKVPFLRLLWAKIAISHHLNHITQFFFMSRRPLICANTILKKNKIGY